jgi:Arc/MetJ-type ribon-helix-helix transcriptional regulator
MADKKRVNLTVNPETKAEWDEAVEESAEYSSLSDLIRQSVAHELAGQPRGATPTQKREKAAEADAYAEALAEVTDTLGEMQDTLTNLDERMTDIEREVTASAKADLKNQVFEALPEAPDNASPAQIADELGEDPERVANVLRQLEEQTGMVEVAGSPDDEQYFSKRGDN